MDIVPDVRIRTYTGTVEEIARMFGGDAEEMAAAGYRPTSQSWIAGSYDSGAVVTALLLLLVGIGVFVLLYMAFAKPPGTLFVSYEPMAVAAESRRL